MGIITRSRGTHSGAEALAHRLAERLGYPSVSREQLVTAAAQRYRIPVEELRAAMERRPSFWQRTLRAQVTFLPAIRATLTAQVSHDNLVYSGYAGHLLLPGISHVVSIRVVADLESRVQAAMQREQLPRGRALAAVQAEDRRRGEWVRFLFGVEWADPELYHLVVNVTRLSQDATCSAIVRLTECPELQATPESSKAFRDLALHSRVLAALAVDFRTRDARLKVTVDDGAVTVKGMTRWAEVAEAIPAVVEKVEGVKTVRSEITGGEPPPGLTWY